MKKGSTLLLTELLVMLLVFLLASACCLRIFFWADQKLAALERKDMLFLEAQNLAEKVRSLEGQWNTDDEDVLNEGEICVEYSDGARIRAIRRESNENGLGKAEIQVTEADGSVLLSLPVCWQEALS